MPTKKCHLKIASTIKFLKGLINSFFHSRYPCGLQNPDKRQRNACFCLERNYDHHNAQQSYRWRNVHCTCSSYDLFGTRSFLLLSTTSHSASCPEPENLRSSSPSSTSNLVRSTASWVGTTIIGRSWWCVVSEKKTNIGETTGSFKCSSG